MTKSITISERSGETTAIEAAALEGSDKQVAFAESVRRDEMEQMIRSLNAKVSQMLRTTGKPDLVRAAAALARETILGLAASESKAAWWLDKRGSLFASDYFSAAAKQVMAAANA